MTSIFALTFLLLAPTESPSVDALIGSPWRQTEIRSLENGQNPQTGTPCQRIWLEQRTYEFQASADPMRQGLYGNYLQAIPMGSNIDCEYAKPASGPTAAHGRTWPLRLTRIDTMTWQVEADHGTKFGPMDLEATPFSTTLRVEEDRLIDQRPNDPLTFRRSADRRAARAVLEQKIRELFSGQCEAVYSQTELAPGGASKIEMLCDLVDRAMKFTGRFRSLVVDIMSPFDAIPRDFPRTFEGPWIARPGAVFQYRIIFERSELFGSAIVWEKGDTWQLAYIWQ